MKEIDIKIGCGGCLLSIISIILIAFTLTHLTEIWQLLCRIIGGSANG